MEALPDIQWQAATIVRAEGSERFTVKLEPNGPVRTLTRDKLRAVKGDAAAADVAREDTADDNPFQIKEEPTLRTWSDVTGKHKVEAQFVELNADSVILKNKDGKTINLPLNKLSPADQQYAANSAGKGASSAKTAARPDNDSGKGTPDTNAGAKGDLSGAQQIIPQVLGGEWSLQVDKASAGKVKQRPIAIRPKKQDQFFERGMGLLFSPSPKPLAILTLANRPPNEAEGKTTLEWCDLSGPAKSPASVPFKDETLPLAISDDGKLLAARANGFHFGQKDRIFLWSIEGNKVAPRSSFVPYPDDQHADHDITWASFVGSDRLLTAS